VYFFLMGKRFLRQGSGESGFWGKWIVESIQEEAGTVLIWFLSNGDLEKGRICFFEVRESIRAVSSKEVVWKVAAGYLRAGEK